MDDDARVARNYLTPLSDSFWHWLDEGEVLAWRNGETIAFREQVRPILATLAPTGLPPFSAVALLLAACRDNWRLSTDQLYRLLNVPVMLASIDQEKQQRPDLLSEVAAGLARVAALPWELRQSSRAKAVLCQLVFEGARPAISPTQAAHVISVLHSGVPEEIAAPTLEWAQSLNALVAALKLLRTGLIRVDAEVLRLRVRTGLDELPLPVEEELPLAQRVRALLKQLENDEELCGLAKLARQLMAAMTLPHSLMDREDLPVGGVSDIVNRGPLDRLLLSELAHDDLTLAVRVALGEALYLRRESPPRTPPRQRAVLLETGIRCWGVPRVFATAVALALAATDNHHAEVVAFRARGRELDSVDLGSREGLIAHLEALDTQLHPGSALEEFEKRVAAQDAAAEPVLVTTDDVLEDHDFLNALAAQKVAPLLVTTVNRGGVMKMIERTARGSKVIREAQLDLADLLREPKRTLPGLIDREAAGGLPAIFAIRFPLLMPHNLEPSRLRNFDGLGVLALTKDRRVMLWSKPGRGAAQLADDIVPGPVQWVSRSCGESTVYAVVGDLAPGAKMRLVHVDLKNRACQTLSMNICNEGHHCVCSHGGALFVVGRNHIELISLASGQLIARQAIPEGMIWQRERFFRRGVTGGWFALSFNGVAASWEAVLGEASRNCPLLLTMFERADGEGPIGVTTRGDLYATATSELRHVNHTCPHPVRVLAISTDGRRVVLGTVSGTRAEMAQRWIVDVDTLAVRRDTGNPQYLADPLPRSMWGMPSLRTRINQICVSERGRLVLITRKQHLTLQTHPQADGICLLVSHPRGSELGKKLGFKPVTTGGPRGYQLSAASWDDGSQAFLDSRGLLHLKSADPAIPEVTVVLQDGMLAGWTSDGRMWGNSYFYDQSPAPARDVYETCIEPFAKRLVP